MFNLKDNLGLTYMSKSLFPCQSNGRPNQEGKRCCITAPKKSKTDKKQDMVFFCGVKVFSKHV